MEPARGPTPYTAVAIKDGCVQCHVKGKDVPLSECLECKRGYVVRFDGEPSYALCPPPAQAATVGDIMTHKAIAVRPEMPLESLILLLVDEGIHSVPVVDAEHKPIGVASKTDLVFDKYEWAELRDEAFWLRRVAELPKGLETEGDLYLEELLRSRTVGDIMSTDPVTVDQRTRVVEAARLMGEKKIHGCPVVDAAGVLIGMVTTLDISRWVGAQPF